VDTVFGWLGLALWGVFYAVDGLLRGYLHHRTTGSTGFGRPDLKPSQFVGGAVAFVGVIAAMSGAALAATGRISALSFLDILLLRAAGLVVALISVGLAAMTPNAVALTGAVLIALGINMHVRFVEEPYLRSVHGDAYLEYAARVGRFIPGVGRLRIER
jgi:hypothetical protein